MKRSSAAAGGTTNRPAFVFPPQAVRAARPAPSSVAPEVVRRSVAPPAWQTTAVTTAWCAVAGSVALISQRFGAPVELSLVLPVTAIVLAPVLTRVAAWGPAAAALVALVVPALDSGLMPSVVTLVGLIIPGALASAVIAVRARHEHRDSQDIEGIEEHNQRLAAANAAQREASEVAEAVLAAARDISASIDAGDVAIQVARSACGATRSQAGAVLLWDAEREVFRIAAVAGFESGADVQDLEVTPGMVTPLRNALAEGVADVPRAAVHDPVLDALMCRWRAAAISAVRLQRGERLLGLLIVARRSTKPVSSKTYRILSGIALQAAAALESASLVNDLRTASNLREEFMATMSHELRTPLNVIIGYTDLQRDGAFGELSSDHLEVLDKVHEQSLQLLELIQATLDVGRIERGLMSVDIKEVSVQDLVKHLSAAIPLAWRKPTVDLHFRVDEKVETIRSDPGKLQVVLRNLVHNALKFTNAGQVTLAVTTDTNHEWVHFVVQDSGVGIAAKDLDLIFEMFRQSPSHDPSIGGVGLGLYIVKRMVELLGGEIDVRSAPDRGATFRVHLPIAGPLGASQGANTWDRPRGQLPT